MATTTSRPKAHLLRELNATRHSSTSSRQSQSSRSSFSDFDPENEAIMSTRQLDDVARKLPELRASAKKYQKPRFPEPEYNIDTSALAKAFPDFSQGSLSESSDISIEIGRGFETTSRNANKRLYEHREFSSNGEIDLDNDSITFKAPLKSNRHPTQDAPHDPPHHKPTIPPQEARNSRSQGYRSSGLRNEIATSPAAKAKDYGSGESRKSSEGARRTLSAMHAKARSENDQSYLAEDRPPTVDLTVRSTRFNSTKPSTTQESQLPTKYRATHGFQPGQASQRMRAGNPIASQTTQGSFQLPEMPNVSELVSGVFEDGTPVYSRHGKSRFGRPNRDHKVSEEAKVGEVPVPLDEQAIFLSLKILEDRVGLLEREKAELEVTVKDLEGKNHQLEIEGSQREKRNDGSDSALGLADSEDQDEFLQGRQRGHTSEKNRLASSVKILRHQLSISERKISTTENIIRNISQERDSAVSQLGVAYVTIEQLKAENESCKSENQELKDRIEHASTQPHSHGAASSERVNAIKKKVADLKEAHKAANSQSRKQGPSSQGQNASIPTGLVQSQTATAAAPGKTRESDYDELFDLTPRTYQASRDAYRDETTRRKEEAIQLLKLRSMDKANVTTQAPMATPVVSGQNDIDALIADHSQAFTELSYIDTRDIESMREALEAERVNKKKGGINPSNLELNNTLPQDMMNQPPEGNPGLGLRRSSTVVTGEKRRSRSSDTQLVEDGKNETVHGRRHSEASILSTRSRRRGQAEKNMTSAFIIPDITIGRKKLTVPQSTPVTDRLQETEPYEDEPTIRPSQPPGLALATVIKCFEDEIAQLKKQLAKYQEQYSSHNPALSKRKRKFVFEKMETTLQAIDAKSDQLYSLHDVLEGQKQSGQELTREEVDVTLQSIGIDASDLERLGADVGLDEKNDHDRQPWDLESENGAEDELPWEGIETTIETNKIGSTHGHRRRGSRF